MRTCILLFAFLFPASAVHAANYYFSSVSGDDSRSAVQAQNPATPWKSLDKFNAVNASLKPGDSVFFKRGEVFYGTMNVRSSGVGGNVIYYGAYGAGASPVISGFATLSSWTAYNNGIYYASLDMPTLNMVTLNGDAKGMGRFPNTGFLNYEDNNGNTSITDNELSSSPNWTGAEIVMRKYRFILDRHTVTNHAGTMLTYNTSETNGNNGEVLPVKGNGYFFQNHLQTLDQFGEWYYDPAAKRLYVHFGGGSPSSYTVKASSKDYNASVEGVNYVTLENLSFEGGNLKGMNIAYATRVLVQNCVFWNQGGSSVYGDHISYVTIKGGSVNTSFSNGINFEHNADYCTVDGVSVNNSNMIAGTGRSGSGVSIGISIFGNNATITNNRVSGAGYSGIQFLGDHILVEKNYIENFCTLKDDGGGVYTYLGKSVTANVDRKIRSNIILNAVGAQAGAEAYYYEPYGKGAGIYLDEHVNNVEVTNNVIATGDWAGIFMHNIHDNLFTGNLIYNHRYQVLVSQYDANGKNNILTNNQYIAKTGSQYTFAYRTFFVDNPSSLGTLNNNYYARPISDNQTIQLENNWPGGPGTSHITLAQWKASYNQDAASQKSPLTYASNIDANLRFEYNDGNTTKIISLPASYVDVKNNQYAGSIALAPFTGLVLLKSSTNFKQNQVITFPAIDAKIFGSAPFDLTATSTSGLDVSFKVVSGPATLNGSKLTLTGMGTVTIEASQAGNNSFKPADPVTQSFQVLAPNAQTINFPVIPNKAYGDAPFTLNATASSGLPVSYQVISGLATLNGNTLTVNSATVSTIIVEATQEGNASYRAAAPVRQSFMVSKGAQTISFGTLGDKLYSDPPFALTATATSGLPVGFKVLSGPATLAGNMVTLTGIGEVLIEASQSGDDNYNAASNVTHNFYVSKGAQTINFPDPANKNYSDPPFAVNATASSGLPVSYRVVSGPATIAGNQVTLTGALGIVIIEASQAGNNLYNPASAISKSFEVSAAKQSQTITFPAIADKTFGAESFALNASSSSGLPVTYKVISGPATVSGNMVTVTGTGSVSIEAAQDGDGYYFAASRVTQIFNVAKAAQSINFGAVPDKAYGDAPFALTATASSGLPVAYRFISGPASLNGNTVTLTGIGTVIIEASQAGNENYNPAAATSLFFNVNKGAQTITFNSLPSRNYGDAPFTLNATASSGLPVSFKVLSGPATLSGNVVTITGVGEVWIEASQLGNSLYNAAVQVSQNFNAEKGNQTINFTAPGMKTYGDAPFALTASSSSGLPVSFQVLSGSATINGNMLTITGAGEVWISASQSGNGLYNAAPDAAQNFYVAKATQTITFPTVYEKVFGDAPITLTATASSGLPVTYTFLSGNARLNGNMVTITGGGEVWIQASQGGNENYEYANDVSLGFWIWDTIPHTALHYEWACPSSAKSFSAGTSRNDLGYQWQVNKHDGGGYVNLLNNGLYSGATSPTLLLLNAPTSYYGYSYRCKMIDGGTTTYSDEMILKFYATWLGGASNAWENKANWSCGLVPDENTDAVVQAGAAFYPVVNSNVACHGVKVEKTATLNVNPGFKLTVVGKAP